MFVPNMLTLTLFTYWIHIACFKRHLNLLIDTLCNRQAIKKLSLVFKYDYKALFHTITDDIKEHVFVSLSVLHYVQCPPCSFKVSVQEPSSC